MKVLKGKGVYGAVALGEISVFKHRRLDVKRVSITDIAAEKARLEKAKQRSAEQLREISRKAMEEAGRANAQIFEIHIMMLDDADFNRSINSIIEGESVNAEYAVSQTSETFAQMFASVDDPYMQARAVDIRDISNRLIHNLSDAEDLREETGSGFAIICADDLAPSETVLMDKSKILGFVTSQGSVNSHTAILARTMNIPAVVCAGDELLTSISDGVFAAVDGHTGEVFIDPDEQTRERLYKKQKDDELSLGLLQQQKGKDNVTIDGRHIDIFANIGTPEDTASVIENDAGGIGLFRSEFLYLESTDYPSEQVQFEAYKKVLESMQGKKVVIRTLDIGADKQAEYFSLAKEENPALGLRGIRLCLSRPEMFRTQLRALYRASVYGDLAIMFPMITSVSEVEKIKSLCEEVRTELRSEGIAFSGSVETGVMIETPAAALISGKLAPMVDFFSIGTNDLTQYTLACDRQNPAVESFADPHHEAVISLIELTVKNAHDNGIWAGICGELASDISLTETFLRMGIDELSVPPSYVLKVRAAVRRTDLSK